MTLGLGQRIAFTLGALLVYRVGTCIPVPGIDPSALQQLFRGRGDMWSSMLSGYHGVHRVSLFSLGIYPYISAAVVVQLLSLFFSKGGRASASGGRYVLGLVAVLVVFQASGIAFALERVPGIVVEPGWLFRLTTVITLTGGTFFLIWLSGRMNERGVGNGLALLLSVGMAVDLPPGVAGLIEVARRGMISTDWIIGLGVFVIAVIAFVVFMELARRRVPVRFMRKQIGDRVIESQPSMLCLKINNAGLIPAALTTWFLSFQPLIRDFANRHGPAWLELRHRRSSSIGRPAFMIVGGRSVIVFFALLYTALLARSRECGREA